MEVALAEGLLAEVEFEVEAEVELGCGGVRVAADELLCWVRLLLEERRVEPTSRLNRELKVEDIGSCRHVGSHLTLAGQQRLRDKTRAVSSVEAKQFQRTSCRCDR